MVGIEKEALEQLEVLVKLEAINLKQFATKDELNKLDINKFRYQMVKSCIYGLMTGNCESKRANELILKCCTKVFAIDNVASIWQAEEPIEPFEVGEYRRLRKYSSPIEKWLFLVEADKHKKLIDFLKGETEELNFD